MITEKNIQEELNDDASQKLRGAPKGPRKLIFIGAAVNNGKLVKEEISFDKPEEASTENAMKRFKLSHPGLEVSISGPYREVRTGPNSTSRNRISLNIPLSEIRLTAKRISGEYNGWSVLGHYLEGYSDKIFLMFVSPLDPNNKKRPSAKSINIVDISVLQNIKQL